MSNRNVSDDPVDNAVAVLNRIHAADPTVLPALIAYRVRCNEAVCDDPTVQVGRVSGSDVDWEVGFLGVVNGLFGVDAATRGFIGACFDDDRNLLGFSRLG